MIRYRLVSLLDRPDELAGVPIGTLDQGDEVQLLERSGFRLRDADRTVVIDAGGDPALAAVIADVENHYLTDADEDN